MTPSWLAAPTPTETAAQPLPFRAAYVVTQQGPHAMHKALVAGVQADIVRVDHWLRDAGASPSRVRNYLGWLMNGWALHNRALYDLLVLEGFQIPPALAKWLRRLRGNQKIVCHHVGEQLYYLSSGFYSKHTDLFMRRIIRSYDAHIAIGEEQTRLLHEVLQGKKVPVYNVYCTHIGREKFDRFAKVTPALDSKRLLFVGNIYGDWRAHYKGLDLLLESFHLALADDNALRLTLVGVSNVQLARLAAKYPEATREKITPVEFAADLSPFFADHSLFVLPARGDAFPTVVLESLAAGMVPLLSDVTGNKEVARHIAPELVVPLDAAALAERLRWYFALDSQARLALSARARLMATYFTEEKGVMRFREALRQIHHDLGVAAR